ncbi:MAG TPA: AtpZ/AtpI family protein [Deltaproteobacteria bacterium]|nr:AtpZ/AtpI family protein [Deltaproteobacteria bacterium]HOO44967.1 AtpZ/AtpI family protein [Deltaproteobacteria bacterium]
MNDKEKKKMYLTVADLSTMGFAMVIAIVLGLIAGLYLDTRFDTEPIFTLLFIFGGILAGFRIMYKTYMRFFSEGKSDGSDN